MLFNSFAFIFLFLPATLGAYAVLPPAAARLWLVAASLFFYGWWNPAHLGLMAASIAGNYGLAHGIARAGGRKGWWLTALGVAANLAALGWYKYVGFFGHVLGFDLAPVVLPLAISFFTFTQIAYLVDVRQGRTRPGDPLDYALFVTFFPHLIAGPIVHYRAVMPQFRASGFRLHGPDLTIGLALFVIGLAKKTLLADPVSGLANPVFGAAQAGAALGALDAWTGALAYTVQLYFDFSGYSDMAIGLARMFSVRFPANFDSPYQARSIVEFWRRWHMTLSRFLRDYLYIPLGGSRHGTFRRYLNLWLTMLLGGLWHGANWTFMIWGALHGFYLVVNHGFRAAGVRVPGVVAYPATFLAVVVGWVFFRAPDLHTALRVLGAMTGFYGVGGWALVAPPDVPWVLLGLAIAWLAPNSQALLARYAPVDGPADAPARRPLSLGLATGFALGALAFFACKPFAAARPSAFLYFNF